MGENIEQSAVGHFGVGLPVVGPDGVDIARRPTAEPLGIVKIPVAEVVHRTDQIIPIVARGEIGDPGFAAC